jgi:CubicO group peptidase (beta-lactamase class C family)
LSSSGRCAERFAPVREAFEDIFASGVEVGGALAVTVGHEMVVDLWGGHMDADKTRPWRDDTIVNLYSVGKGVTAICALHLADRGALDLDAPVARYWAEFGQAGKAHVPVRYLLTHQVGLPAIARTLPARANLQWHAMTEALAAQAPWWTPGARHGYHVNMQGFLVGEVVRRITGKTLGTYLRDEIAGPAGIDFVWGFGPELDARVADTLPMPPSPEREEFLRAISVDPATLSGDALMRFNTYRNPPELSGGPSIINTREWRAAEAPSTNGHGNARGVARLYSALATDGTIDGVRILSRKMIDQASREQVYGEDVILGRPTRFGLGFQLTQAERRLGPNPRAFGHFGAGGSLGFADPDGHVAFAYAMNQGRSGWQHKHVRHLIDRVYESL